MVLPILPAPSYRKGMALNRAELAALKKIIAEADRILATAIVNALENIEMGYLGSDVPSANEPIRKLTSALLARCTFPTIVPLPRCNCC